MIVSLFRKNRHITIHLPQRINGQYWLEDLDEKGNNIKIIGIEAIDNDWYIKSNKYTKLVNSSKECISEIKLEELRFYKLSSVRDYTEEYIYTEPDTDDRLIFTKYLAKGKSELTIGRDIKNKIIYDNGCVSSRHATLLFDGVDSWSIIDEDSSNGTYVNEKKVTGKVDLESGDIIYILGLKIVIGGQFIAVNNPDEKVKINSSNLVNLPEQKINITELETDDNMENSFYFRSPKFQRNIETFKMKIDPPPQKEKQEEMPLAFVIGPSMTMGIASIFTAMSSIINYIGQDPLDRNFLSILPTIAMAIGMLAGTILWPILTKKVEKKNKAAREKGRKKKYVAYLNDCRETIQKASDAQKQILLENNPSIEQIAANREFWDHDLWSRQYGQHDFLNVRIGNGNIGFDSDIKFPEKSFSLDDDDLIDEVQKMASNDYSLKNVPVTHSIYNNKITGIASVVRNRTLLFINNLIIQMTMFQSYDELKIVLIGNSKDIEEFQYLKWIPHFWNNEKSMRFLASSIDEIKELSNFINKEFDKRLEKDNDDKDKLEPHYVIIAADKELSRKAEFISKIINCDEECGFSLIFAYGEMKDLPKECSTVIEINNSISTIYDKDDLAGFKQTFEIETISNEIALQIAKELSNISLDLTSSSYELPAMLSFLDMFGVGKIEHLNALTRWKENNPVLSLQVPVGIDTNSELFMLDLHEKAHGPHGLIAGMTGSGKSEFIISFILSLALNYHPDEVSFILIDYKGGGLTGAFESDDYVLPHLAGTITNLDGSSIKRSLLSIESELRRRQTIFNDARRVSNEGTMDIYKYQKLYRNGVVREPLPHLFIISDEFAELKAQQPEFMDQLISTARIGRSLGVHLILATQKPSGVVDDQIWSNSRFRVCLKVQDKSDSMDMIKRADAAEISQTGRFYLQVGFNELFELGQSAWSGAPYIEKETTIETAELKKVSLLDNLGRETNKVKLNNDETLAGDVTLNQVVEINKYIFNLAQEENAFSRALWLPPIPADIYVDELCEKYNYNKDNLFNLLVLLGEIDDPSNQKQTALTYSFGNEGNLLLFGSIGSGKSMFLTTMLYSLLKDYSASELNVYIIDFGSEIFGAFSKAPQVADVVFSTEHEKIKNLFKLLLNQMSTRKKLFADYGGTYKEYISHANSILPNIVVMINNFVPFYENYEEYDESLMHLLREGSKYGIYFAVTANNFNEMRYRIIQNFNQQFVLQQNDTNEYAIILGPTGGMYPTKYVGRGLLSDNKRILEFQTARAFHTDDLVQSISAFSNELYMNSSEFADKIPVLPENVNLKYLDSFPRNISSFAIGVDYNSLKIATVNLDKQPVQAILTYDKEDCVDFCLAISKYACSYEDAEVFVFDSSKLLEEIDGINIISEDLENQFNQVYNYVYERNNSIKSNNGIVPKDLDMHQVFCMFFGLSKFIQSLSVEMKNNIKIMFDKLQSNYNVKFFIFDNNVDTASYSHEDWYKRQVNGSGIWVGDGVTDQYAFPITKRIKDLSADVDNEYGFVINRGKATLVKLINDSEE